MASKNVIVEMDEQLAYWLQMIPECSHKVRIIGEFVPAAATPNNRTTLLGGKSKGRQEFPRGTRLRCQHRPPESAPTRRAAWDFLKDRFGDMVITSADARQSIVAHGIKGGSVMVTQMLRLRELKPVTE